MSSSTGFSIDRKYERVPELRLVHLWHVHTPTEAVAHCMTQAEAVALGEELRWTATPSWTNGGKYSVTRPGPRIVTALDRHVVRRGEWRRRLFGP